MSGFTIGLMLFAAIGLVSVGAWATSVDMSNLFSQESPDNEPGAWADRNVKVDLDIDDKFTGNAVNPTAKVYSEKPAKFGDPSGDFDDGAKYDTVSMSSGTGTYSDNPGTYYAVIENGSYNTEFVTFDVPTQAEAGSEKLSDYNSEPRVVDVEVAQTASLTTSNGDFSLSNKSSYEDDVEGTATVAEDVELRGRDIIVTDNIGLSDDGDNDGVGNEGINEFTLEVIDSSGSVVAEKEVYDASAGIDEFESDDEYTLEGSFSDFTASDDEEFDIRATADFETTRGSSHSASSDDEILTEGEGDIVSLGIFDQEDTNRGTVKIQA